MNDYQDFLQSKLVKVQASGFDVPESEINSKLFDWQRDCVRWALRLGRAALFQECGLGKTPQQLEWARHVMAHTGCPVLILAPLAVAHQTVAEGVKFGIPAVYCRSQEQADANPGKVIVANYEMLQAFDVSKFAGVVLDESSILKAFTGATKRQILETFQATPYKLACTATPAPNDHLELGNHAEFLNIMASNEMISRWFINDSMSAGHYRLKGHAASDFWRWVASWAVCISKPSDLGAYSDEGFNLPELRIHEELVGVDHTRAFAQGRLFVDGTQSATAMWAEKRATAGDRCQRAREIVGVSQEPWIVWCDTNDEADQLINLFPEAVEVRGSDSIEYKENSVGWFCGELCRCQLARKGSGAKRVACGSQSTTSVSDRNTILTQNTGLKSCLSNEVQKRTASTCEPTTRTTKSAGRNIASNTLKSETADGASDTPRTPLSEMRQNERPGNGQETILAKPLPRISSNLELPPKNTMPCLPIKEGGAQSVDAALLMAEGTDCTLTTTMKRDVSGDCSAETATSELANSKTIRTCLSEPCSICGQRESRRILISKSEMFGWGLNLQHCHNQVFVGVTYSFEKTYQALRRSWRFGQRRPVDAYLIYAESEGNIKKALDDKRQAHAEMQAAMTRAMHEVGLSSAKRREVVDYDPTVPMAVPGWLRSEEAA